VTTGIWSYDPPATPGTGGGADKTPSNVEYRKYVSISSICRIGVGNETETFNTCAGRPHGQVRLG
jgi:hypothetical protein